MSDGVYSANDFEQRTTLQRAIHDHITALESDNSSRYTLVQRLEHLRWFSDRVKKEYNIIYVDELRVVHLHAWINHLQKRPSQHGGGKLSDVSIQGYGRSLITFCHWMEKEEVLGKPVTTHFKLPKVEKKFIPPLLMKR